MEEAGALGLAKQVHDGALVVMTLVYTIRLFWLFRWKGGKERQPSTAKDVPATRARRRGVLYSWGIIGMPWAMESYRKKAFLYAQFILFHIGVAASITLAFGLSFAPESVSGPAATNVLHVLIGAALIVAVMRIIRRLSSPVLRAISSLDDHFSLWLLTVWFGFAFAAVPGPPIEGEWYLLSFFLLTAFFLIYVPFSKISHYLYYPFTRFWFGKSMGYRGVYPLKRGPKPT